MSKPIISFEHVTKEFRYYGSNHQRFWHEVFWTDTGKVIKALDDVSFTIEKGEKVALIGRDRSGRSTAIRLMAKIIKPNSGKVRVRKKPEVIFNHRLGFDGGLTGRDNIKLKAAFKGWSRAKTKKLEPEIIEFADIKDIVDEPVKSYPPGTLSRMGFAMNTIDKPELLLFDEIYNFGRLYVHKCLERFYEFLSGDDITFVMTVGNANVAKKICTRGIVLDEGKLVFDGPIEEAIKYFRENCKISLEDPNKDKDEDDAAEELETLEEEADFNDFG